MRITDIFKTTRTTFSFEFFPPKDAKTSEQLFSAISELIPLKPAYVSVTYGAGGSTRLLTHDLVARLLKETNVTVAAHLTCVGSTQEETGAILRRYQENGVENIFALRGDPPHGQGAFTPPPGGFPHAADLVAYIKKHFPAMTIGVAGFVEGHPETPNRLKEIEYLKRKVDAGADYICTQLFFDNHLFYDFCERCELAGIRVPIIAGIMPVSSIKTMERMAELSAGTHFPAKLLRALSRADNDRLVENVGVHWATGQVLDLIDHGVKGIHFYTLNRSRPTLKIYDALGVTDSSRLSE